VDLTGARTRSRTVNRREVLLAATALPLSLAFGRRAFAHSAGGSVALITADLESQVVVLDTSSARVLGRIRTGPGPRSIENVDTRLALVAHTQHGLVSLVDAASRDVRAELDGFSAPRYTTVHPARSMAYVTDSERDEVVAVDVRRGRVVSRALVPGPARHVSISPDGKTIWTALGSRAEQIAVLDSSNARRPRLERTFAPPFLAHDVVFAPRRGHVWVTSGAGHRVALYRAAAREVVRTIAADRAPQHVAFVSELAFVSSGDDGTVRIHRLNGDLVRVAEVPTGSYNVSFGAERVVTPSLSRGTVALLDEHGHVRAVRTVARAAHDACVVSAI
jgi:DNA-binding beta-propeller fold protein YncE